MSRQQQQRGGHFLLLREQGHDAMAVQQGTGVVIEHREGDARSFLLLMTKHGSLMPVVFIVINTTHHITTRVFMEVALSCAYNRIDYFPISTSGV